ncbi:MAG: carbohydrate ABC transporter permease [Lachnospiraceae bacterium]|jgi:raffinose/stachyose/melibiose transport system permease protein|nr:carbohydrate ABC transporter permease [Lachnospiraceae bacterium]
MGKANRIGKNILLALISAVFISPIVIVFFNSFKSKLFINNKPFMLPDRESFVGLGNYIEGVEKIQFFRAFAISLTITVCAVSLIILLTSMTAWYIVRVKSRFANILYFMFAFSMMVPFQMVMFTLVKISNMLNLDNLPGIIYIYVGFGSGLSVFMFTGFIKSIPVSLEEAAMMDGCSIMGIYNKIILPVLKPIVVTVSVLNTMWIWNDYLLPYLVIGSEYRTIPVAIQYLRGGYGSIDLGLMLAMLVLAIIPIIVFYVFCQKWIIKGVLSGAVKG